MYKITWDKETGGVLLNQKVVPDALSISPRPVFWEELDLLQLNEKGWVYPHSEAPLMWACNKQYYYRGQFAFDVHGANIYDAAIVEFQPGFEQMTLQPVDMKLMLEKNREIMFVIESEAIEFIRDTYVSYTQARKSVERVGANQLDYEALAQRMEQKTKRKMAIVKEDCDSFEVMPLDVAENQGKRVFQTTKIDRFIASFSGGKDSQVVLDLCTRAIPSTDFEVIYSDTGYELPPSLSLYEDIQKHYKEKFPDLKFSLTKNHESVLKYWDKIGTPSDTHRWCCSIMKTAPLYRSLKLEGNKQAKVLAFDGVRAEESVRREGYQRKGKGKHTTIYNAHPILYWNTTEIFLYLFRHKLIINLAYRQGKARVGCIICPFSTAWDDMIVSKCYEKELKPFFDRLITWSKRNGIKDIAQYMKERKWKIKAIGDKEIQNFEVSFPNSQVDFVAIAGNYNYTIFTWLPAVCEYTISQDGELTKGELKYKGAIYSYEIRYNNFKHQYKFTVFHCHDLKLIYLLKRVIYKSTYCVQCEVCEVDCPTGALSIVPQLQIDKAKCIHCHKCLNSHDRGCIAADSIRMIKDMDRKITAKVHAYKTFGMRDEWVGEFFSDPEGFWENNSLGSAQIDGFKSWLKDSEVIDAKNCLTPFGYFIKDIYIDDLNLAWELLLVNLSVHSFIVNWFANKISVGSIYDKQRLNDLLGEEETGASPKTRENAIAALLQLFSYSPIGTDFCYSEEIDSKKYIRREYQDVSEIAIAYSLFKYSELTGIHSLRVADFYTEDCQFGPYRVFGLGRSNFEKLLRTLNSNQKRVLIAELNMGLDNISLREDLSSLDVVKMLVE